MRGQLVAQFLQQFRLHELELVGNLQSHDLFAFEHLWKLSAQQGQVTLLHDENHVRPAEMPLIYNDSSARLRARRASLITRNPFHELLGR